MSHLKMLAHVCLGVTDLAKTMDFYCGLLGCGIVHEFRDPQGELYGVFLYVNNGTFLEFFKEEQPKQEGGLFRHLCFEVEDIQKFADKLLKERGLRVEIVLGKTDHVKQFWIKDPDGHMIEFQQYDRDCVQYQYMSQRNRPGLIG